ncbi:MAG: hypothetical protein GTN53_22955 [Candidatus Aminicenantes bacterium]|nr:hypothetical protein [Candidatus Aminicenantes bacterium]NIQ69363.1 hypothetical protein [Candidatus Aminicenantes bacterium]NIT25364.1 hypothetical protein [Candidatus Aminicenantes bacterium]
MKKLFKHTDLSDRRCIDCGRRLKKNLIARRKNAARCYKCHRGFRSIIKKRIARQREDQHETTNSID